MNRSTLQWTLVLFFGGTIVFGAIRRATADESAGVSLLIGAGVLVLAVAAIVLVARRRGD